MTATEKAARNMEAIANNDYYGYSQFDRWNHNRDCSSAIIDSYQRAGVPLYTKGARSTWDMVPIMLKNGFKDVTAKVNLATGAGMKRADVLMKTGHTGMYVGNGLECEATSDEKGGIGQGAQDGDQTGVEIGIFPYQAKWSQVLRYEEEEYLEKGDSGDEVYDMQVMLISLGYTCSAKGASGKFDAATERAVKAFQKDYQLTVDGKYGKKSKTRLETVYKNKITSKWKATGTAVLIVDTANLRGTASGKDKSNILGKITKGQRFEVDGKQTGPWVHVKHADIGIGYVTQRYLKYDSPNEKPSTAWKATGTATCKNNGIYVRSTPSSASRKNVVGALNRGQRFEVDGKRSGDWVHVKVDGIGIAWMHKAYVVYD